MARLAGPAVGGVVVTARRFTDAELLAICHDPRPLWQIGAELVPPLGQPRLSTLLAERGLSRGVLRTQRARARAEKTCKRCGETRPATAEHFDAQLRNRDGLCIYCKDCRRRQGREAWAKYVGRAA